MRIGCIIITYNRKLLLKNCIDHIFEQTLKPTKIIIVDNFSTDNTKEYIEDNFHEKLNDNTIIYLSLADNLGGAGGFHEGMKHALNFDFEWLWLMDDDGYPERSCLSNLYEFAHVNNVDAISPIQLNINIKDELAFPVTYKNQKIVGKYDQLSEIEFIHGEANLFNGLLIRTKVVENIGLPKSELFIRGDEVEYTKRMKNNEIYFGSLVSSIFYHPSDMNERIKVLFGLWTIRDAHSDFKNYYMFRNRAVAFIEDGNALLLPLDFIRYSYYFMIHKRLNWKGLKLWCTATYDGIKGKLGRHPKY